MIIFLFSKFKSTMDVFSGKAVGNASWYDAKILWPALVKSMVMDPSAIFFYICV
jgi:hypothetical protein